MHLLIIIYYGSKKLSIIITKTYNRFKKKTAESESVEMVSSEIGCHYDMEPVLHSWIAIVFSLVELLLFSLIVCVLYLEYFYCYNLFIVTFIVII